MKSLDEPTFVELKEIAIKGLNDVIKIAEIYLEDNNEQKLRQCCYEILTYSSAYLAIGLFTDETYQYYQDKLEVLISKYQKRLYKNFKKNEA